MHRSRGCTAGEPIFGSNQFKLHKRLGIWTLCQHQPHDNRLNEPTPIAIIEQPNPTHSQTVSNPQQSRCQIRKRPTAVRPSSWTLTRAWFKQQSWTTISYPANDHHLLNTQPLSPRAPALPVPDRRRSRRSTPRPRKLSRHTRPPSPTLAHPPPSQHLLPSRPTPASPSNLLPPRATSSPRQRLPSRGIPRETPTSRTTIASRLPPTRKALAHSNLSHI